MPTSKDRPGHRDDDVIWLLSRIAGLLGSQGKGTSSNAIPRGLPTSPVVHYIRLVATAVDLTNTSVLILQMPITGSQWELDSCQLHRVDGAATVWAPRFGQIAAFADDGPDDRLGLDSQAFAIPFREVFCEPVTLRPDSADRLYFKPGLDAGTDNDLDLQFWFKEVVQTEEST